MLIQKLRLKRGWSQQQLAEASGLSTRTIQRIESGMPASTETLKSIAAVFEVDFSSLNQEETVTSAENSQPSDASQQERAAFRYVRQLRGFYIHLFQYIPVALLLVVVNLFVSPRKLWSIWVVVIWGLAILIHAAFVFGRYKFLGPEWELRVIEKRLGRPL